MLPKMGNVRQYIYVTVYISSQSLTVLFIALGSGVPTLLTVSNNDHHNDCNLSFKLESKFVELFSGMCIR